MNYGQRKEKAREEAINWQYEASQKDLSYGELADAGNHFEKLGRRYGLIRVFRENGIPC